MKIPVLYLLRHGQTEWNLKGRFQGHLNSNLTTRGKSDAATQGTLLRQVFNDHPDVDVFASPQGRVRETVDIALQDHPYAPAFSDSLKEIDIGLWSGLTLGEIEKGWPSHWAQSDNTFDLLATAPDGETLYHFFNRARGFLRSLNGPSVVFCHGALMAVLRTIARDHPAHAAAQLVTRQGCIYHIENGIEKVIE